MTAETIQQLLALLPPGQQEKLVAVLTQTPLDQAALEQVLTDVLSALAAPTREQIIGKLIGELLPLDTLVPPVYAPWRALVRDAASFIGGQLSLPRLVPKVARQLTLPVETTVERRLLIFVEQMPALQKIGQIIARNPHLDVGLRAELTRLENAIQDVTPATIFARLHEQLSAELPLYQVETQGLLLAEASVSAVVRFTWRNPATQQRERGIFKVLKPYVTAYFAEELTILRALADFFDQRRTHYNLPPAGFRAMLDEVRLLLQREVDLPSEQAALRAAHTRYAKMAGVRTPRLIPMLSTPQITAMSEEQGVKVTEAFRHRPAQRRQVAERLIEAVLAAPLFATEAQAFFHADPHAGNLLVDEETGDLILLDWALVERLSQEQRRQLVLLALAFIWRDATCASQAIANLAVANPTDASQQAALIQGRVAQCFAHLSPLSRFQTKQLLTLLDQVMASGVAFPAELLLLRKTFFTLSGVLQAVDPTVKGADVLSRHLFKLLVQETPQRWQLSPTDTTHHFSSQLTNYDLTRFTWSLPLLPTRLGLQFSEQLQANTLATLHQLFERARACPPPTLLQQAGSALQALPARWAKPTPPPAQEIPLVRQ